MKTKGIIFSTVVVLAIAPPTDAEMHEFMLPDGRTLSAEIVDFNARLGQVELKREDGKHVSVKPNTFVAADQDYIKDWAAMDGFRNASSFRVSCKKDLVEKWKEEEKGDINYGGGQMEKETISETKFERYVYEILLENRGTFPLENLKLEYRIYYDQSVTAGRSGKVDVAEKIVPGSFEVARLAPSQKQTVNSEPAVIHEKEYLGDFDYSGGDPEKEEGEVKGIWVRIHATSPSGQNVTREIFEPENIEGKYIWPEHVEPEKPKKQGKKKN